MAFAHFNVSEINCPYLIRPGNGNIPQQIREYLMFFVTFGEIRLRIDAVYTHFFHISSNQFPADSDAFILKLTFKPSHSQITHFGMPVVNSAFYQLLILRISCSRCIINAGSINAQYFTLRFYS